MSPLRSRFRPPVPTRVALAAAACCVLLVACGEEGDGPDCGADDASEVCEVFRLVNAERDGAGLDPYGWSPELYRAAQDHAQDMVDQGYFSHDSLDGRSFSDRAEEAGYPGFPRGENIAAGQQTPEQVMDSWMNSQGHRANILSDADEIGVGLVDFHWVQVFGQAPP